MGTSRVRVQCEKHGHIACVHQGVVDAVSAYNPLDLFSLQPTRMRIALEALWQTPHNNLKLFVDGRPIKSMDAPNAVADALPGIDDPEKALLRVVASVLTREGGCFGVQKRCWCCFLLLVCFLSLVLFLLLVCFLL